MGWLILFVSSGCFLGWSLGSQDASNVFGTAVATNVVKYRTAVIITAIFVVIGALVGGAQGMGSISDYAYSNGIHTGFQAFWVMLSAGIITTLMTIVKMPVSTSQCVIGSMIGWGFSVGSADLSMTTKFVSAWVVTPVGSLVICYLLCRVAERYLAGTVKNIAVFDRMIQVGYYAGGIFSAFALGANNVANVTGIYVGEIGLLTYKQAELIGGLAIALGVLTFGKRVMLTVGKSITTLSPLTGVLVVFAASITVFIYSLIGIPVSTSQAVIGAVIGAGLTKGKNAVNFKVLRNIFIAWFGTPSLGALFTFIIGMIYRQVV